MKSAREGLFGEPSNEFILVPTRTRETFGQGQGGNGFEGALIDEVDADLRGGRLTPTQLEGIEERNLDRAWFLLVGLLFFQGPYIGIVRFRYCCTAKVSEFSSVSVAVRRSR